MTCNKCGGDCHGRLCSFCETEQRDDGTLSWGEVQDLIDENRSDGDDA
jgi:recombinational DNA repair protein RecR